MCRRMKRCSFVHNETASCAISLDHLADRRDDVGVGRASTDVPAHAFPDLGIGKFWLEGDLGCDIAWPTSFVLGQDGHGRTNLARRAVAALQCIMAYKGGLHRVKA